MSSMCCQILEETKELRFGLGETRWKPRESRQLASTDTLRKHIELMFASGVCYLRHQMLNSVYQEIKHIFPWHWKCPVLSLLKVAWTWATPCPWNFLTTPRSWAWAHKRGSWQSTHISLNAWNLLWSRLELPLLLLFVGHWSLKESQLCDLLPLSTSLPTNWFNHQ